MEWETSANTIIRVIDRQRSATENLVRTIERQASIYGKTGVDRLVAEREQLIKRLGNEEVAVKRVTAAYDKMIAAEGKHGGSSGFSLNYALRGVKDLFEGRGTYAIAELTNEVTRFGGSLLGLAAGVGVLAGIGYAAYEANKKFQELAEQPAKIAAAFRDIDTPLKQANDQLKLANDHLRNDIAALQGKPRNALAETLDQPAISADRLAVSLQKDSAAVYKLLSEQKVGAFSQLLGFAGTDDLRKLFGGVTGFGGDDAKIAAINRQFQAQVETARKGNNLGGANSAIAAWQAALAPIQQGETNTLSRAIQQATQAQGNRSAAQGAFAGLPAGVGDIMTRIFGGHDQGSRLEIAQFLQGQLAERWQGINEQVTSIGLEQRKTGLEALERNTEALLRFQEALARYGAAETGPGSRLISLTSDFLKDYTNFKTAPERQQLTTAFQGAYGREYGALQQEVSKQALEREDYYVKSMAESWGNVNKGVDAFDKTVVDNVKHLGEASRQIASLESATQREGILRDANKAQQLSALAGGTPGQQIERTYQARIDLATQLYSIDKKRADLEVDSAKQAIDLAKAKADFTRQSQEAELARTVQIAQEQKKQFDQIKSTVSGLLETLFNKPRDFSRQLLNVARQSVISPVVDTLSSGVAGLIRPLAFAGATLGATAGGLPIANIAGGPAVRVTVVGSDTAGASQFSINAIQGAIFPSVGRGAIPSRAALSAPIGSGSTASPSASVGSVPAPWLLGAPSPFGFGLGGPLGGWGGNPASRIGPGGTAGFAGPVRSLGGGSASGGSGGFGGLLRGGAGNLSGLIGYQGGGVWNNPGGGSAAGGGWTTVAGGVASSPLAAIGGTYLAQRGLLGADRGTIGGIFEGAAGGAAIGFQVGGPLGAAIGAGVGGAIGLGEKLAGVESPVNEAERLVKSLYHLTITSTQANQIVSLANQSYGGRISIAVRSPQVREMLNLFAAGTNQNSLISASMPHAGNLLEQGGQLYQNQSVLYGRSYAFASPNIPIYGGQPTGGILPNPGSPVNLSLSINSQGAGQFLAGQVVTSDYVQAQWSSAQSYSNGRLSNSAALNDPGFTVLT